MEIYDCKNKRIGEAGFFVRVTEKEALQLIKSLSAQIVSWDPNGERLESNAVLWSDGKKEKNVYFTISVNDRVLEERQKERQKKVETIKPPKMKTLSFELTMPNVGSWNGKWTGSGKKYFVVKSVADRYFGSTVLPLLDGHASRSWYYDFGDGWGANVKMEAVTSAEARARRKVSAGFCGYEWMVDSILAFGDILSSTERKQRQNI